MEKEIFKDIPGYEGLYQVSSEGRVKSLERYVNHSSGIPRRCEEKEISQATQNCHYKCVTLCKLGTRKTYRIHVLVAMAFLEHKRCGHNIIVDHINNDRSDNRLINLQLTNSRINSSKDRKVNSSGFRGVSKTRSDRYISKIYDKKAIYYLGTFDTPEEAHEAYLNKLKEIEHISKRS